MDDAVKSLVGLGAAIIGLAVLSVLVSKNAQTTNVITASSNAFVGAIKAAVSPITG